MAERKPIIPESQLLDLIRNPFKAKGLTQQHIQKRMWLSFLSPTAFKARFSFFFEKFKSGSKWAPLDFKEISQVLNVVTIVVLVYFIGYLVVSVRSSNEIPNLAPAIAKNAKEHLPQMGIFKNVSDYIDKSNARDIFKFGSAAVEPQQQEAASGEAEVTVPKEENPLDHLALVGIGFSGDPDVMIKDVNSQQVYFLKRGELIGGDIKVKNILEDHVILLYQGKEFELK